MATVRDAIGMWRVFAALTLILDVCPWATGQGLAAAPKPPVIMVQPDVGNVLLGWYGVPGASGYEVLRTSDPSVPGGTIATLSNTQLGYRDRGAPSGISYYQLVVVNAAGRAVSAWVQSSGPISTAARSTANARVLASPTSKITTPVTVVPAAASAVSQAPVVATLNLPAAAKTNLSGVVPGQAAAKTPDPNSSWQTSSVLAAIVTEPAVAAIVQTLDSFGVDVTAGDQQELEQAAELAPAAAVAACETAVLSVVQELPALPAQNLTLVPQPQLQNLSFAKAPPTQLTLQQVNQIILRMPTGDASTSRLSNDVKALLGKIKPRSR